MICLLNMETREQKRCGLKELYLFHRLKYIFAVASDICFQTAIHFLISACLVGLFYYYFSMVHSYPSWCETGLQCSQCSLCTLYLHLLC